MIVIFLAYIYLKNNIDRINYTYCIVGDGMNKIETAIFPVAGIGSRFGTITKYFPKEMLPLPNIPVLQYSLIEALSAGIKNFIFVIREGKNVIVDYIEDFLLNTDHGIKGISIQYVQQNIQRGLGDAVLCAREVVHDDVFAVVLPDDVLVPKRSQSALLSLVKNYIGGIELLYVDVPEEEVEFYGILDITSSYKDGIELCTKLVEKPKPLYAPSNKAVVGRYLLRSEIFEILEHLDSGVGGEIQLTDAINKANSQMPLYALKFEGTRFDCGNSAGFFSAMLHFCSQDQKMCNIIQKFCKQIGN